MTFSKLGNDTETNQLVYLPKTARTQGLYIIGIQGTGKSGLIENLIMQDIDQQIGVCVLDPHGELIDQVIARLEPKNEKDVVLLDLTNYSYPFGLNLFECPDPTDDGEIVQTLYQVLHVFEKAYGIIPTTPLMYDLLYNAVYTLIANPGYTMIDIRLLLTNETCRKKLVRNVPNSDVSDFWSIWDDPKQTTPQERENKRGTILNKMNEFSHVPLRNIVGQSKTTFSLQDIMDTGKILLVKLSRRLEKPSNLIGSILIAQLLNAAYARPVNKRKQFHLYADEFQNFATEDFAILLEEARKFGIGTTIAHQNRSQLNSANNQLETNLKDRSRSVGSLVVFKINSKDADDLAGEFNIVPPTAETRSQAIRRPVKNVIKALLEGGQHKSDVVNQFATTTLNKLNLDRQYARSQIDLHFFQLNTLLYDAMVHQRFDAALPIETLKYFLIILEEYGLKVLYPLLYANPVSSQTLTTTYSAWDYNAIVQGVQVLWTEKVGTPLWHQWVSYLDSTLRTYIREDKLGRLNEELRRIDSTLTNASFAAESAYNEATKYYIPSVSGTSRASFLKRESEFLHLVWPTHKTLAFIRTYWEPQYPKETWYHIDFDKLEYPEFTNPKNSIHPKDWIPTSPPSEGWQSWKFYNPADLDRAIEEELQEQKTIFLNFFWELKAVCQALAQTPILADSGEWEEKPLAPRTYADVQNEIANSLVGLPNFTARIKIGTNNRTVEHTVKTLAPGLGIGKTALQQRIATIQANNIHDMYLRERTMVEAEITQRQTGCSGGSSPAQPQSPQQPRHARQVPVQGNCPNCGKSNPPGAKFCNQCGGKL